MPWDETWVRQHERLVWWVYHRLAPSLPPDLDPEDYVHEGWIGLMRAAGQWDPARGTPWLSYAIPAVMNAMRMAARPYRRAGYRSGRVQSLSDPLSDRDPELTWDRVVADPGAEAALDAVEWHVLGDEWVTQLSPAQQRVWAYWREAPDTRQGAVARALGLSQSAVSRQLRRIAKTLADWVGDAG